jgi:hypothetical protein
VLIGGVGLVAMGARALRGERAPARDDWQPAQAAVPSWTQGMAAGGPVTLKPKTSPLAKVYIAMGFAVVWNGILAIFVWQAVRGFREGSPEWFLVIFLIPFVLIGLAAIGAIGYFTLALFSPRPVLTLSGTSVPLGGTLDLQWSMLGRVDKVARLTLYLEGREEATYTRGTDTVTDKKAFATVPVAETADRQEMLAGQATVAVPPDTMHSFAATHNKIVWALHLRADIPRWPDVKEEFPITVLPVLAGQEGGA